MKITLCSSMQFRNEIIKISQELSSFGHLVQTPILTEGLERERPYSEMSEYEKISLKKFYVNAHIKKIEESDAILVLNYPKNGITGYIGANTFMEISFAYILKKKIFVLFDINTLPSSLEILSLGVEILSGDIKKIK